MHAASAHMLISSPTSAASRVFQLLAPPASIEVLISATHTHDLDTLMTGELKAIVTSCKVRRDVSDVDTCSQFLFALVLTAGPYLNDLN